MVNSGRLINIVFIASFVVVLLGAFLRYYILREYVFTIETSCNATFELCFHRSCEEEECPPNGYEDYKVFEIPAHDFDACEEDDCEYYCRINHACSEIPCDPETETCSGLN